jgi:hypothetical protein
MPIIAPWLKAPDIAEDYLRGLALGQQAADTRQRLAAEQQRTAMEAQARQDTLQREALQEQQRIAIEKAYRDSEIGLQQQRLAEVQRANAEKTRAAAMKLHQQTTFNKVYQDTGDVQQALFASGLGTPQNVLAARKDVEDLGAKRLAQREESLELRKQEFEEKKNKKPVPRRIGEKVVTDPITGDKTTTYQFDQPTAAVPAAATTAAAPKRFKWDASKSGLVPVGASAPTSDVNESDEQ